MTRRGWVAVALGDAAAAAILLGIVAHLGGEPLAGYLLTAVFALVPGALGGWAFGRRERDVALPTWAAAGFAAFVVGLATPFVAFVIFIIVALSTGNAGE